MTTATTSKKTALRPGFDYLLLRIVIFALIGIGLLMAYSATMATSLVNSADGSVWAEAVHQTVMVCAGLVVFWIALRVPPRVVRKFTWLFVLVALSLLILVLTPLGTGRAEVGSQSWIVLGPISIQPSEIARVAIALCGAAMLANKTPTSGLWRNVNTMCKDPYVHYVAIAALFFILIALQNDMGMAVSFALVVVFTLLFAGLSLKFLLFPLALVPFIGYLLLSRGDFRSNRFHTYFDALTGNIEDTQGSGFQTYQGFLSLADGGLTGVGLGQSRAKWFYLPEVRNDFVFAIVGEELAFWGASLVIVLFAVLGLVGIRTAMRAQNQFQSLVAATLTAAVVSQAFVNISYVIGLLPVTGIQLPMISSGGSATIITIGAMGLLCSVARHEPEQVSAMQNYGRPMFDRLLVIPEPTPSGAVRSARKQRHAEVPARGAAAARRRPAAPVPP
ncbi:FtsW/RodA/SpoVE family cell cycle protein, partial [Corynebacterium phocae]